MRVADLIILYDYNYWANDHILRPAAALTNAQFTALTRFPHDSLRSTLVEIMDAERTWLDLFQGKPWPDRLEREAFPDLATLHAQWHQEEAKVRAFLATLADEDLDQLVTVTTRSGESGVTASRGALMVQPVTHGTQHRSEAAQILTEFGRSPGDYDLVYYLVEHRG